MKANQRIIMFYNAQCYSVKQLFYFLYYYKKNTIIQNYWTISLAGFAKWFELSWKRYKYQRRRPEAGIYTGISIYCWRDWSKFHWFFTLNCLQKTKATVQFSETNSVLQNCESGKKPQTLSREIYRHLK